MANDQIAPVLPPTVPRRPSALRRSIGIQGLRLIQWRVEGNLPDVPKLVIIVAPHTSNWDFVVAFLAYLALQLDATWFGKHTLFRWPMGVLFRYFGGIPIERSRSANVVDVYIEEFARRNRMVLAIAPEGTRKRTTEWKTGFYHIALGARTDIVPVALDYPSRRIRIFDAVKPTGDLEPDLEVLRSWYRPVMARYPEKYGE
ncbi:MAG: lysophospholipid acyltransferase family protein [Gemmatimonadaceae bacterium]